MKELETIRQTGFNVQDKKAFKPTNLKKGILRNLEHTVACGINIRFILVIQQELLFKKKCY